MDSVGFKKHLQEKQKEFDEDTMSSQIPERMMMHSITIFLMITSLKMTMKRKQN